MAIGGETNIIELQSLDNKEIRIYSSLTEQQLKQVDNGLFIAESPKVIRVALEAGYEPVSMLCERKHITGDAADIIAAHSTMPVYTGQRELLAQLTGYRLTRGVLCAMRRKTLPTAESICRSARTIAVIEAVCDTTNIGSIFRSAAALGIDGVLLSSDSCDPLNRRAVRVSMGTVFKVPWTFVNDPVSLLNEMGITTVALALDDAAIPIDSLVLKNHPRLALVLGTEGDGLTARTISKCRYKAIIPMHRGVDSLNVGSAAAIAFWQLKSSNRSPEE